MAKIKEYSLPSEYQLPNEFSPLPDEFSYPGKTTIAPGSAAGKIGAGLLASAISAALMFGTASGVATDPASGSSSDLQEEINEISHIAVTDIIAVDQNN